MPLSQQFAPMDAPFPCFAPSALNNFRHPWICTLLNISFVSARTIDGNRADGAACHPWFVYKGVNYTDCTLADNPR